MTITAPEVKETIEEDLELLFLEKLSMPCDCDHEKCSKRCKGHHLALATQGEIDAGALDKYAPGKPCPRAATWVISLRGQIAIGYVPPSPRYICDKCKSFWSANGVFEYVLERL